jgi:hypothetical protein
MSNIISKQSIGLITRGANELNTVVMKIHISDNKEKYVFERKKSPSEPPLILE